MKILLDMDGVLVDFVGSACKWHGLDHFFDDSINHGKWDINQMLPSYLPPKEFWGDLGYNFWRQAEPMPDFRPIMKTIESIFRIEDICILSSPCATARCMDGKEQWIRQWLPEYKRRFLFGSKKEFCAGPNRILIDDYDVNVSTFRENGGQAVLVPRLWNSRYLEVLKRDFDTPSIPEIIGSELCNILQQGR